MQEIFRCNIQADQLNWLELLDGAVAAINNSKSSSTGLSPFEIEEAGLDDEIKSTLTALRTTSYELYAVSPGRPTPLRKPNMARRRSIESASEWNQLYWDIAAGASDTAAPVLPWAKCERPATAAVDELPLDLKAAPRRVAASAPGRIDLGAAGA